MERSERTLVETEIPYVVSGDLKLRFTVINLGTGWYILDTH